MINMWIRLFCVFLVLGTAVSAQAQVNRFGLGYRHGYLLAHHQELKDAYGGLYPSVVEFNWLRTTDGEKEWERVWNYPDVGLSFSWINPGDPELGQTFYATVFLQKYIGNRDNDLQFSFKVAPGLSYTTNHYEPEENENNTFISTPVNMIMEGNFLAHYTLDPAWSLYGGVVFTHYSNGGVKLPNSGFNIPSATLGIIYQPASGPLTRNTDPVSPISRRLRVNLMYGASLKSEGEDTNDLGFAWNASAYAYWRTNHRSALTAGADLFYNSTIPVRLDDEDANPYRIGLHAGHDLVAGNTSILFQLGYYVYRPEDIDKPVYWRVGVKQHITPKIFGAVLLKAHLGRADLIEWGIGYQL